MIDAVGELASEDTQNEGKREISSSILSQINALNHKIERLEAWKSKVEGRQRRFVEDFSSNTNSYDESCKPSRLNDEPRPQTSTDYDLQVFHAASASEGKTSFSFRLQSSLIMSIYGFRI